MNNENQTPECKCDPGHCGESSYMCKACKKKLGIAQNEFVPPAMKSAEDLQKEINSADYEVANRDDIPSDFERKLRKLFVKIGDFLSEVRKQNAIAAQARGSTRPDFAKVIQDMTDLFEAGMDAEGFLNFIGSGRTDVREWAKDQEPDYYKAAFLNIGDAK